jgi:hypothetical protein
MGYSKEHLLNLAAREELYTSGYLVSIAAHAGLVLSRRAPAQRIETATQNGEGGRIYNQHV